MPNVELQKAQQKIPLLLATDLARLYIITLWGYIGIKKSTVVKSESFQPRKMNVHLSTLGKYLRLRINDALIKKHMFLVKF